MPMRGKLLSAVGLGVAIALVIGCHKNQRSRHFFKPKEECVEVPDEPRFNNPPSAEYRARVKPTDDKSTLLGGGASTLNKTGGMGGRPNGGF
jgi:hypothetical protein